MNRREMIKVAYQTPPKNEVIDEIDALFKQAAGEEWLGLLEKDPKISKVLAGLPAGPQGQVRNILQDMFSTPDQIKSVIGGDLSSVARGSLKSSGYLPSDIPRGVPNKILGTAGKILTSAAPVMVAGAGLYGLSNLINYVKDRSKNRKLSAAKSEAFNELSKDPAFKGVDKKELKKVFDLYADVSPMVVNHPILASSLLKDYGNMGGSFAPQTLKTLGEIYANKEKAMQTGIQARNTGWMLAASDPQKLRNLITESNRGQ